MPVAPAVRQLTASTLLAKLACAWALAVAGDAIAQQVVRAGIYANPPKVAVSADGAGQGIFAHVLEDVAAREGWRLDYVNGTFEEGLQRLESGEIDVMVDVAKTPERERRFEFGQEPVLLSWNQVYARHRSGVRNLLDLEGRRVAVLRGSVQESFLLDAARSFGISPVLLRVDSYDAAFDAVRAGHADAVVTNPFFGSTHLAGLEDTSIIFGATSLHFAARRGGSPLVLAALDTRLAQLRSDPGSWFFREQQRLLRIQRRGILPEWVAPAATGLVLFLAVALGWGYTLRRDRQRLRAALLALEQRGADLERANADLQTMGYSLSHDLRSPLAAVKGFVQAVLDKASLDARESNYLERSVAAAQRMDLMVGELATLLQLAGAPLRIEPCDLSVLAQEVAGALRERFESSAQVRITPGLHARADCRYVRIALENLLGNAWKFSARTAAPAIEFGSAGEGDGGTTVFFVRDNGAGFDMEHADRLFRPFSRLHDASEFAGTGMGLSIVQRVVARHGGRVWAQAAPGEGATFYFTLPAAGDA